MFKGNSSVSFKSSKTKADVIKIVEEQLENMGNVSVSSSGGINITGSKFSGFGYDTNIEGRVNERDGRFTVNIDFEAKPATASTHHTTFTPPPIATPAKLAMGPSKYPPPTSASNVPASPTSPWPTLSA